MLGVTGSIKDKLNEKFGRKGFSVRYHRPDDCVIVVGPKYGPQLDDMYNVVRHFPVEISIFKANEEMFIVKCKNGDVCFL